MSRIAFLFPGQGSQYVGMGGEIMTEYPAAGKMMEEANEILGFDLKRLCLEGPAEELNNTSITQPAVYTVSLMINRILKDQGVEPAAAAGHSLGEYSALAAADVFSFGDGLRLVRERGLLMDRAFPGGRGTMAAVIGLEPDQVRSICQVVDGVCQVANFNSPQQVVISGENEPVKEAVRLAEETGAKKVVELDVSGPFHSPLMKEAREELGEVISKIELNQPAIPVVANVTADYVQEPTEIRQVLTDQLTGSVRWLETINRLISDGVETFVEVGPGRVLKGLMRRINRGVDAYNVEDIKSLNKFLGKLDQ